MLAKAKPLIILSIVLANLLPNNSVEAKRFTRVKAKSRTVVQKNKSWLESRVDTLIKKHIGEDFRRATIYDIYPEIKTERVKDPDIIDLAEYFDYTRKDLKKVSQGEFLKTFRLNFDLDGWNDYIAIICNQKTKEKLLLICNEDNILLLEKFMATHLELLNYGKYPTTIPTKASNKTIHTPAVKLVSFDDDSYIIHFNTAKKAWEKTHIPY